jgi:hypothetical protein
VAVASEKAAVTSPKPAAPSAKAAVTFFPVAITFGKVTVTLRKVAAASGLETADFASFAQKTAVLAKIPGFSRFFIIPG